MRSLARLVHVTIAAALAVACEPSTVQLADAASTADGGGDRDSGVGGDSGLADTALTDHLAVDAAGDGRVADSVSPADTTRDLGSPGDSSPELPDSSQGDVGVDAGSADSGGAVLSRGLRWVREQPMFLSGLTVSMGPPPATFVDDYYDGFRANATHLWENGMPTEVDGWASAAHPGFRWVSWTLPDGTSRDNGALAGGYGASPPGRIGFQVSDEPRDLAGFEAIAAGVAALRSHDPEALLIVNFMPSADNVESMLEAMGTRVDADVISYDRYTRGDEQYEAMALFRRAGLAAGIPYWRYIQSYQDDGGDKTHHESDLRWDAFSGLLFGFTGHTWFLYQVPVSHDLFPVFFDVGGTFEASKTPLWDTVAQINLEMLNLGRSITQLTSTDVRYVPASTWTLPVGLEAWAQGAGDDPYITAVRRDALDIGLEILVGFFVDARGARYVMVQNVRHESGDFPVQSSSDGTVLVDFDFSEAPAALDRTVVDSLDKLTGEVDRWALDPGASETATLEVTLAAGDPFLFKYADGSPFALAAW